MKNLHFVIFMFLASACSAASNPAELPAIDKQYMEILKSYSRVLMEEFCYSTKVGCKEKFTVEMSKIQFDDAVVGAIPFQGGVKYYVVAPWGAGAAYTVFYRKRLADLQVCLSAYENNTVEAVVKNIKLDLVDVDCLD